jgi:5'-nucleotidase
MDNREAGVLVLNVAHISDTHSHFDSTWQTLILPLTCGKLPIRVSCGGYSRIANFVNLEKNQNSGNFLFLHSGDSFEGTLYFSCFKGKANADLLNEMKIDAMAVGNHELDMGDSLLAQFVSRANFPILSANMAIAAPEYGASPLAAGLANLICYNNPLNRHRFILKKFGTEVVALFGLSLDNMMEISNPGPGIEFLNSIEVAKQVVAELMAICVNKIILVSHLGYERDVTIARQVVGISAIFGGHSHLRQGDFDNVGDRNGPVYGERVNDTVIFHSGDNAVAVGMAVLKFNARGRVDIVNGGNVMIIGREFEILDPELAIDAIRNEAMDYLRKQSNIRFSELNSNIEAILNQRYREGLDRYHKEVVAQVEHNLRHVRVPDDTGGSQVAPLVAESLLYHSRNSGLGTDFALVNAGVVRSSLDKGSLTAGMIAGRMLPFSIGACHFRINGQQLRLAIEGTLNNALSPHGGTGSFPYSFNLRFEYKHSNQESIYLTYIQYLTANGIWQTVRSDQYYNLVTTTYIAAGKEGYAPLVSGQVKKTEFELMMSEIFILYARKKRGF